MARLNDTEALASRGINLGEELSPTRVSTRGTSADGAVGSIAQGGNGVECAEPGSGATRSLRGAVAYLNRSAIPGAPK